MQIDTASLSLKNYLVDVLGIRSFLSDKTLGVPSAPALAIVVDEEDRNLNRSLFEKIIAALNLPVDAYQIFTSKQKVADTLFVLWFGQPNLPNQESSMEWPRGTWRSADGFQEMWTHSLSELANTQAQKKEAWTDMKRVLSTMKRHER